MHHAKMLCHCRAKTTNHLIMPTFFYFSEKYRHMKKLIFLLIALIMMGNASFAQDKMAKQPKQKVEKAEKPKAGMKKDGTPDMRRKENKKKKEAAGPMKKDGTPDMRYKANKGTATKKTAENKK
jgi:hypothetical protein